MELKNLKCFLEIAREENMSKAAVVLGISQSAVSKRIQALEKELGKVLFIRHSSSIELTEEGKLLAKHAEDMISLSEKIKEEFSSMDDIIGGNIYFGCAESYNIRDLALLIADFKKAYPHFHYHFTSGDTEQITEKLDKGLLDFGLIVEEPDYSKYNSIKMPCEDEWGLIMPSESHLANNDVITINELKGLPLFCSQQGWKYDIAKWCGKQISNLTLEGSFRLSFNASVFVREGLGYLLSFRHLVNTSPESGLAFRPLYPPLKASMYIIWRKKHAFSPLALQFARLLEDRFSDSFPKDTP